MEMGVPGFDCIVYKDGSCIFRNFDGYSDINEKLPITGEEKYFLYSCSKPITCTAALQLYEKGLFRLEDDLCTYIPEFADMKVRTPEGVISAKNRIKIHDLFTTTAGFSYEFGPWTQELGKRSTLEAIKLLAQEPLYFEPGSQFRYSFCHDVLAALIEVLTGKRFSAYVEDNIFQPLAMHKSTFDHRKVPSEQIATLHIFDREKARVTPKHNGFLLGENYESGGAGCISTVSDYILFLEALRKGDILISSHTTDIMASNYVTKEQLESCTAVLPRSLREGYGYGLGVRCPVSGMPYTDFGWDGAAGSNAAIDRKNGLSVFVAERILRSPSDNIRLNTINMIKKDLLL